MPENSVQEGSSPSSPMAKLDWSALMGVDRMETLFSVLIRKIEQQDRTIQSMKTHLNAAVPSERFQKTEKALAQRLMRIEERLEELEAATSVGRASSSVGITDDLSPQRRQKHQQRQQQQQQQEQQQRIKEEGGEEEARRSEEREAREEAKKEEAEREREELSPPPPPPPSRHPQQLAGEWREIGGDRGDERIGGGENNHGPRRSRNHFPHPSSSVMPVPIGQAVTLHEHRLTQLSHRIEGALTRDDFQKFQSSLHLSLTQLEKRTRQERAATEVVERIGKASDLLRAKVNCLEGLVGCKVDREELQALHATSARLKQFDGFRCATEGRLNDLEDCSRKVVEVQRGEHKSRLGALEVRESHFFFLLLLFSFVFFFFSFFYLSRAFFFAFFVVFLRFTLLNRLPSYVLKMNIFSTVRLK